MLEHATSLKSTSQCKHTHLTPVLAVTLIVRVAHEVPNLTVAVDAIGDGELQLHVTAVSRLRLLDGIDSDHGLDERALRDEFGLVAKTAFGCELHVGHVVLCFLVFGLASYYLFSDAPLEGRAVTSVVSSLLPSLILRIRAPRSGASTISRRPERSLAI